jgi:hypothetical protein
MSWIASVLVALLAAAIGLVLAGFIASGAVSWYRISSFEGGAGYFVVGMALLGAIAGFVIGLVSSRFVAASAQPGAWYAIGWSQLILIGIAAIIAGIARLSADVAPKLNGEALLLMVELQWPATQTTSPARCGWRTRIRWTAAGSFRAPWRCGRVVAIACSPSIRRLKG